MCFYRRSVVGIHAADVLRVARYASRVLGLTVRAVMAHEQLTSAVLHAAVVSPADVANVAMIGAVASYEMAARSRLYDVRDDYAQVRATGRTPLSASLASVDSQAPAVIGLLLQLLIDTCCALNFSPNYQLQIFGVLAHYDVPDLVAALAHGSVFVGGLTDSIHVPLSLSSMEEIYHFAAAVLGPGRLSLTNTTSIQAVVGWLKKSTKK